MPESPEWLTAYKHYDEAERNLKKMASWNGVPAPHLSLKREEDLLLHDKWNEDKNANSNPETEVYDEKWNEDKNTNPHPETDVYDDKWNEDKNTNPNPETDVYDDKWNEDKITNPNPETDVYDDKWNEDQNTNPNPETDDKWNEDENANPNPESDIYGGSNKSPDIKVPISDLYRDPKLRIHLAVSCFLW